MATQWITAAQALALVGEDHNEYMTRLAICDRAQHGLLKAKAQRFVADKRVEDDILVPREFWWAGGHEALEQDWKLGEFSTWINQTYHWKAFGVRFDLDGVLAMVPADRHARIRRSLSVTADPDWISAKVARRRAYEAGGINPSLAGQAVIEQGRLGFLDARAVLVQRAAGGKPSDWTAEEREWTIPDWFWREFTGDGTSSQDWELGKFAGKGRAPSGRCWMTLTGVHFSVSSIDAAFGPTEAGKSPKVGAATGGRPPAAFWDDMWNAIWGDIYHGTLIPQRQADIERAMLDWIVANGHEASPSAVKPRARKMLEAMGREDKNPRA